MRNKAIIHQMGLNHHDLTLINCLVNMTPKINENFEMQRDTNGMNTPDVMLINADKEQVLNEWQNLRKDYLHTIPILVTSSLIADGEDILIRRPIVLKRLSAALEDVVGLQSVTQVLNSNQKNSRKNSKHVLIVDDSFPVRKYMEIQLSKLTNEKLVIDFASSGEEAQQKFEETNRQYDLVFLDVVMPDIDGYQVCKWIKSRFPTYVVMLTGRKSPIDKIKAVMSGSNNFLTKPPNQKRLQSIITKCFESIDKKTVDTDIDFHLGTES